MAGGVGKLEAAFGANRAFDPAQFAWTDLTSRVQNDEAVIRRGRASGGADRVQPGQLVLPLENDDAALTPRNAASIYHPNLVRGTPVRYSVAGVEDQHLLSTRGAGASTADAAALDIVGDMAGAIEFLCPARVPLIGDGHQVVCKAADTSDQRSWEFWLTSDGRAYLGWYTAGTAASLVDERSPLAVPRPDSGLLTVAWELDVSNGVGGYTVNWYAGKVSLATLVAAKASYLLGSTVVTTGGATSIFSSSAPLELAKAADHFAAFGYPGRIRRFRLLSGTLDGGTIVANPDFTAQATGATGFTDSAGRVWSVTAPATISDTAVRFMGELAASQPEWPGNSALGARVDWEMSGVLRRMRQGQKPIASALRTLVMSSFNQASVDAYWPMEDGSDAKRFASPIPGVRPMSLNGDVRPAADPSYDASLPLPSISNGKFIRCWGKVPSPSTARTAWRVDHFVRIPAATASATYETVLWVYTGGTNNLWKVSLNNANYQLQGLDGAGTSLFTASNATDPSFYGNPMLVSLSISVSGSDVAYRLSMVPIVEGGGEFALSGTRTGATLGNITRVGIANNNVAFAEGYTFGHMIVSHGTGLGWLAPADSAYLGEPATQRFGRLCSEQGIFGLVDGPWGIDWADVYRAGVQRMGPQRPLPLLTLLEECADVDQGRMGESHELLALTYRSGITMRNQGAAVTGTPVQPFTPADDDQQLVNDVTVKRPDGSEARLVADAAAAPQLVAGDSITRQGLYDAARDAPVAFDFQLPDQAGWWRHEALWPEMRYPSLVFELAKAGAPLSAWLWANLGDIIKAQNLPAEHPTTTVEQLLEGFTERISPHLWTVTANGLPAGPWTVGVRDTDRRDTAGSQLTASVTTTATSLSVATTSGPLWTTAAGDMPFDIDLEGEQCTVTAATGATSPQTFTVTRSVNGVVKAHSAAAPVKLWRPAIRAL